MKISYHWLKEYVAFHLSPQELAERLTDVGLVVADVKPVEDDFCLDIEVTSNRPDCLGVIGIAREVAAIVGGNVHFPETNYVPADAGISQTIAVTVDEPILCPRYTARVIRQIIIAPSPEWMQKRLRCIGLRPVNNIVDITNYVMMETGQPLHAFDLDKITEQKIVVRKARSGEEIVALNGARRALFHNMLVIADGKKPVAIAGVMGGKETEVSETTRNILLECAQFEPRQVRRTSRELGIASDSSYRFERGTDYECLDRASQRAARLIKDCSGGEIASGALDIKSGRHETKKITLRVKRLHTVLGTEIKRDLAIDILNKLSFTILNDNEDFIAVEVPGFRSDVYREIDLIEEIARIYGYNKIPVKTSISVRGNTKSKYEVVEDSVRQFFIGLGFYEVKTFSIVDTAPLQSVNLWSDRVGIEIVNPLRQEESRLRTSLLPSLIGVKGHNLNHGTEHVRIFEIAKVYLAGDKLPQEKNCLSLLADADFLTIKGVFESLTRHLGIVLSCEWLPFIEPRLFRNERAARIQMGSAPVGYLGEASQELGLKAVSCLVEIDLDLLGEKANFARKYQDLPQYPAVFRDLALLVNEEVTWSSLERSIMNTRVDFLKELKFFDVYRGKQIPAGKKSVAFSLCFQAKDRTLTGEEVDHAQQIIVAALSGTVGAELRKA
ncbi:MAG: phenylalanine--tRNA ligase subunit beta [Candidatus Brocadia sp. UTAMX2]|jgi:phenylalanyl-tRNA synthetase beta chain|nr:MAG: phenylalanine--tRNA ligase subunit beta [Candidatus Brocadia sp. UTAMX2]